MMPYTPIIGTLGYILSPDQENVLLIHRNARQDDDHLGKYNGLGGKLEANENVWTGMVREIKEETSLDVLDMQLRGTINWTGFGKKGEDWLGFIFLITKFEGHPFAQNQEGDLVWQPIDTIDNLPMWEGDRHFLPLVFDDDPRPFHGYMPYAKGRMMDWQWIR